MNKTTFEEGPSPNQLLLLLYRYTFNILNKINNKLDNFIARVLYKQYIMTWIY